MTLLAILLAAAFGLAPELADRALALAGEEREGVTVALDPQAVAEEAAPLELPPVAGPEGRPLVVIDAGHGGRDPGASAPRGGPVEKEVTLALAEAIRDELLRGGRTRVALTRDGDRYVPLEQRYEIARRLGAGLFISVHADAAPRNDDARGATIYTLSEVASDREAAELAAEQNRSDVIAGVRLGEEVGVNRILIDLAQRESMNMSADFARLLQREASPYFPFRPEYHRFASLIVLKAPDVPSILFESGYLTNEDDAAYIASPEGRQQIATGMRRAIEAHFARRTLAARRS
jgi:N-acetylmuramoyl-L-alanine amidase